MKKNIFAVTTCTLLLTSTLQVSAVETDSTSVAEQFPAMEQKSNVVAAEATPFAAADQEVVNIPDVALKSYLNGLLKQDATADITAAQMSSIKIISLSGANYTDLTGLEYAVNLDSINISNTSVTDFAPALANTSLTFLTLNGATVTNENVPDLNHLVNLIYLSIGGTEVDNQIFAKLDQLPALKSLYIQNNMKITDISSLVSLPNLETLFVQFDGITDFTVINQFPSLKTLAATGQNTGRYDPIQIISASVLTYDENAQTLFIPFSIMTNRLTGFDGYQPPFSLSNSASNTYLAFDDVQLPASQFTVDSFGITVSGMDKEAYDHLEGFVYNSRYDNAFGSYPVPPNISYSLSAGTYYQTFQIRHSILLTADPEISYLEDEPVDEATFLANINATVDDGSPVTSDFSSVVDFSTPGTYSVTLNAENEAGLKAEPVKVIVHVLAKPVISADPMIVYQKGTNKSEADYLSDIFATTDDGSPITSNFNTVVDFSKAGSYLVTLNAVNARGQQAEPVQVEVVITETTELPAPEIKDPESPQNQTPEAENKPKEDIDLATTGELPPAQIANNDSKIDSSSEKQVQAEKAAKLKLPDTGETAIGKTTLLAGFALLATAYYFFKRRKTTFK